MLITESAGLCSRCSPYINAVLAICVIDNLSGINTPRKIGPCGVCGRISDYQGDIVSQAEREVFVQCQTGQLIGKNYLSTASPGRNLMLSSIYGGTRHPYVERLETEVYHTCCGLFLLHRETRIGDKYQMGIKTRV